MTTELKKYRIPYKKTVWGYKLVEATDTEYAKILYNEGFEVKDVETDSECETSFGLITVVE